MSHCVSRRDGIHRSFSLCCRCCRPPCRPAPRPRECLVPTTGSGPQPKSSSRSPTAASSGVSPGWSASTTSAATRCGIRNPRAARALARAGFDWEVVPAAAKAEAVMCPDGWVEDDERSWSCYPTYDQYTAIMNRCAADHPEICRLVDLGPTTNTVRPHRLWAVIITDNPDLEEDEPEVLLHLVHPRRRDHRLRAHAAARSTTCSPATAAIATSRDLVDDDRNLDQPARQPRRHLLRRRRHGGSTPSATTPRRTATNPGSTATATSPTPRTATTPTVARGGRRPRP